MPMTPIVIAQAAKRRYNLVPLQFNYFAPQPEVIAPNCIAGSQQHPFVAIVRLVRYSESYARIT